MESYLRNNPGVRWSIIFVLLLCLTLEGLLISNRVLVGASSTPPDSAPTQPAIALRCRVVGERGVNMRQQPTTEVDNVIVTLAPNTDLTPLGRSGDVPWLLVEVNGQQGWVSSKDVDGGPLVQCDGDPLILPEAQAAVSAANQGENSPSPTVGPTLTPEPTLTAAPNTRLRVGNGPDLHAARRAADILLDGDLQEWAGSAATIGNVVFGSENWTSPQDLSGIVRAAWDEQFLYLAAQVTDEAIVQVSKEDLLVRGDALEFFWDGALAEDFDVDGYNEDDSQMVMSPGNFAGNDASAWVYFSPNGNFRDQISVASARTAAGYNIEVRLPWSSLAITPRLGAVFGYAVALSDDDSPGSGEQESQMATCPNPPFRFPARWGNLILD